MPKKSLFFYCPLLIFISSFMFLSSPPASAQNDLNANGDIFEMPLESLLDIEVTSVSKRPEKVSEASAAIFVITNEDIRRSGVTSIPEALRMAPGIQVARIDSNKWAISARGFNGQLANKLLVLIDGRDVYTPLFSGVNWDEQDVMMEDIDRIEVIRGSGATLWGANAVNGVINIITKKATDTQGTLLTATVGSEEEGAGAVRYGGNHGNTDYRIYAKGFTRDDQKYFTGGDASDSWRQGRSGFRIDWGDKEDDALTVQGDIFAGEENRLEALPLTTSPFTAGGNTQEYVGERRDANILARWNHTLDNGSKSTFQFYYDKYNRNNITLKQNRNTVDFDYQHTWDFNESNELIWGAGYRYINEDLVDSAYIDFNPEHRIYDVFSSFIQNKFIIIPDTWSVTLGSKFEHNDFTGFEFQPNIRTAWNIDNQNMLWGAVSRAVRTPSRAEDDIRLVVSSVPNVGLVRQIGSREFDSEELVSYEAGYRYSPSNDLSYDFAIFHNDYDSLRTLESSGLSLLARNNGTAESYGLEASVNWIVNKNWQLTPNYTFITIDTHLNDNVASETILDDNEGETPKNQFSLLSKYDIPDYDLQFDNFIYYVDTLSKSAANVEPYVRFDARLGWRPISGLELSIAGQNLFDDYHLEYDPPIFGTATEIRRSVYAKAIWEF